MLLTDSYQSVPLQTTHELNDVVWFDMAQTPAFRIFGAAETAPYRRLPTALAQQLRKELQELSLHTSGIRARFWTDSPYIALHIHWNDEYLRQVVWYGMRGFDLFSVHEGKQALETMFRPPLEPQPTQDYLYKTPGDLREYLLNLPLYNQVSKVYIGVQAGSFLSCGGGYHNALPVVFYGSSITQGAFASRPGNSYENILSRALNMDYVNLGFSGNCKADPVLVDYMAKLPMSCFVCDYDHNAPDPDYLEKTHYDVYCRIRKENPTVPFIMVSKPDYRPGNVRRRCIIMDSYRKALATGDENVYFIDGSAFFSGIEREACTMDGTHPNDLGLYQMAQGMVHILRRILYGGGIY